MSVIPISEEIANAAYDPEVSECIGPLRTDAPKIWWKENKQHAYFCFCQTCYNHDRLTTPSGKTFTKDELHPAYIVDSGCSCDGSAGKERRAYAPIDLESGFRFGVHVSTFKRNKHLCELEEVFINVSNLCKIVDGTLYVPDPEDGRLHLSIMWDTPDYDGWTTSTDIIAARTSTSAEDRELFISEVSLANPKLHMSKFKPVAVTLHEAWESNTIDVINFKFNTLDNLPSFISAKEDEKMKQEVIGI